jgi:NAD(P)-dependent dehydrogenase (short-subunit alcohol dehydrogenase family)
MRVTIDFDNVMLEEGYNPTRAYGQSKLAQIFFTFDLAEELEGTGVIVSALHPATMMDTRLARLVGNPRTTVGEGADAVMNLVETPGLESGQYFMVQTPTRANPQAYDETARTTLRELSRELTGLD